MANKLFLIGNGFDLAHDLPTSYNDFILWYLNKAFKTLEYQRMYDDNILEIEQNYSIFKGYRIEFDSIDHFLEFRENLPEGIDLTIKTEFFKLIIKSISQYNWVDIEYAYYQQLTIFYRKIENENYNVKDTINYIISLNHCLDDIKKELMIYLDEICSREQLPIPEIAQHFNDEFQNSHRNQSIVILNFNYTNTVNLYRSLYTGEGHFRIINIHGDLTNSENPPIFGYGDETDSYYSKIEALNSNEMLKHIKSFGYLLSDNYQRFNRFLDIPNEKFEVVIMGHSCGISDRLLFNTIVEHQNCKSIKIYYHQKSEKENDFYEKTIELSRHFSKDFKKKFREIVKPLSESKPLISWKG